MIANGEDFHIIHKIMNGSNIGTFFKENRKEDFHLIEYLEEL